jgi:hypothetical protein
MSNEYFFLQIQLLFIRKLKTKQSKTKTSNNKQQEKPRQKNPELGPEREFLTSSVGSWYEAPRV